MKRCISFIKKHPKTVLVFLVLVTALIVYHQYIFNNYVFLFTDCGSDTTEQYIMEYNSIVNHIRGGNFSLWDFTNGFGTSMFKLELFNPMLWLLYLAGILFGPQVMPGLLIYLFIFTMVLAALAAWYFLGCFSFSNRSRLLAAYIYAFNGFLTVWGQHYQFGMIIVYLPLLLGLTEKALQKRKFSPAVAVCTGCMVLCTYYRSYMSLILVGCYVILRTWMLQRSGIKAWFKTVFCQVGALLLGIGIGMVNLLPAYSMVYSVSARMDNSMSLLERCAFYFRPWESAYYQTLGKRFFSSNLEGTSLYSGYTNYYEAPSLFFSGLFIILFVQFLILLPRLRTTRRNKLILVLSTAGGVFSIVIMFGSMVFNAFAYPFARHTFLFMPLFALLTAFMMEQVLQYRSFSLAGALISAVLMLLVYGSAAANAETFTSTLNPVLLCLTGLFMIVCLLVLSRSQSVQWKKLGYLALTGAIMLNLASDTYVTVAGRGSIRKGTYYFEGLYGSDIQTVKAWLSENDSDFYRMEKDFAFGSKCMDSLGQYYRGISTYNSTTNKNLLEFTEKLLPQLEYFDTSHYSYQLIEDDDGFATLFGIKYLLTRVSEPPADNYTLIGQFGSLYLYQNTDYHSFAGFYTEAVTETEYEAVASEKMLDTEELLTQCVILSDDEADPSGAFSIDSCAMKPTQEIRIDPEALSDGILAEGDGSYSWTEGSICLPFTDTSLQADSTHKITATFQLSIDCPFLDVEIRTAENRNPYPATVQNYQPVTISLDIPAGSTGLYLTTNSPGLQARISGLQFYVSEDTEYDSSAADIVVPETDSDSKVLCNVQANTSGYLFLPIPYQDGWTASIDGEQTEILRADYGFSAIRLDEGSHTVIFRYHQPLLKESLIISGISAGIVLIILLYGCRKKRLQKKTL